MAPANAIQPARHWRLVITRLPSLLPIILLLSLYAPVSAQTPSPVDGGWPRDTTTPSGARLIIYQPRIATRIGQSDLVAVRIGDRKMTLAEQRAFTMSAWAEPFVKLRLPHITSLRRDPFERAVQNSNTYWDFMVDHAPQLYLMQGLVASEIENFIKFPPRQKPAAFNLDKVMRQVQTHK